MLIVISGGSTTAEFLISSMLHKGHRIVVIEEDREQIEHLSEALPPQVLIVEGDGCDSTVQLDAGVDDADLFVALMGHDDTNLVACEIAMTNFRVPRCIATVNSPKNERIFKEVGIEPVSSTKIIGRMIDEKVCLEGMFTIVLRCMVQHGKHIFRTQSDGLDVAKTPMGMFEAEEIPNDLKAVDDTICAYYEIGGETK